MWSVPFNLNLHDAYFAVGMIFNRGRFTSSNYWFNQMYYSEKGPYKRGSARGPKKPVTFENSAVLVYGTMEENSYHPVLNISVLPQVRYKLAPEVWRRLYRARGARYTGGSAAPALLVSVAATTTASSWLFATQSVARLRTMVLTSLSLAAIFAFQVLSSSSSSIS